MDDGDDDGADDGDDSFIPDGSKESTGKNLRSSLSGMCLTLRVVVGAGQAEVCGADPMEWNGTEGRG